MHRRGRTSQIHAAAWLWTHTAASQTRPHRSSLGRASVIWIWAGVWGEFDTPVLEPFPTLGSPFLLSLNNLYNSRTLAALVPLAYLWDVRVLWLVLCWS